MGMITRNDGTKEILIDPQPAELILGGRFLKIIHAQGEALIETDALQDYRTFDANPTPGPAADVPATYAY